MEHASKIEALPLWKDLVVDLPGLREQQAGGAELAAGSTAGDRAGSLYDLFTVVSSPPSAGAGAGERFVVYAVTSQQAVAAAAGALSQVTVRVASAEGGRELQDVTVEVPGYDVRASGPFRQLLVSAGGRGLLLLAGRCCAAAALPAEGRARATVRAVPLLPPAPAVSFVKAAWHPLSDAHVGLLLSDGAFELLHLAQRAAVSEPEVHLQVTFGGGLEAGEAVADFAFCGAPGAVGAAAASSAGPVETAWLAMSVLFVSSRGRLSFFSPVLPSVSVFPTAVLDAVARACSGSASEAPGDFSLAAHDWLRATLLCSAARGDGTAPSGFSVVKHSLHLHGNSNVYAKRWSPQEQVLSEDRSDASLADASPRSPKHARSSYCSAHLVAHSPVAVVARSTTTGLVEVLICTASFAPRFKQPAAKLGASLHCSVFDEIDLAVGSGKCPAVRLSGLPSSGSPLLLARSRTLMAAIVLPWVGLLAAGGAASLESLPQASAATLAELRAPESGEIAGWQVLRTSSSAAGVMLRVGDKVAAGKPAAVAQTVDLATVLAAAGRGAPAAGAKGSGAQASSSGAPADTEAADREEFLRHLTAPVLLPKPLFGAIADKDPEAVVEAVNRVQTGLVADLSARRVVLRHLVAQLPGRANTVRAELKELRHSAEKLRSAVDEGAQAAERIQQRQSELDAQQRRIVSALAARLELRGLDGVASGELPRLWAQLHDLRQAFELLRAAAAPEALPESAHFHAEELVTLERLQSTWTGTSASRLREQAEAAEAAVDAASRRAASDALTAH